MPPAAERVAAQIRGMSRHEAMTAEEHLALRTAAKILEEVVKLGAEADRCGYDEQELARAAIRLLEVAGEL